MLVDMGLANPVRSNPGASPPARGLDGAGGRCTGNEARKPYHKKEPAGFHDGEPSKVGMEGKHHGKTRSTRIIRQNQTVGQTRYTDFFREEGRVGGRRKNLMSPIG